MKNILIAVISLCACCVYADDKPKSESPFELKEIYLQVDIYRPYLVTEEPIPTRIAYLGNSLRVWVTVQLRPGAKSPCTSRDEEQCRLEYRIANKDRDRSRLRYAGQETRINNKIDFSLVYPIERDSTTGEKVFLFRVVYKDKVLSSFEFPLEVKE